MDIKNIPEHELARLREKAKELAGSTTEYQTEYSSTLFMLYFLGELAATFLMCAMTTILFLGGWLPPFNIVPFNMIPGLVWFLLKIAFVFYLFSMVKALVPRYRYDQLMRLGWKIFLPLSLTYVVLTASYLFYFNLLPII